MVKLGINHVSKITVHIKTFASGGEHRHRTRKKNIMEKTMLLPVIYIIIIIRPFDGRLISDTLRKYLDIFENR